VNIALRVDPQRRYGEILGLAFWARNLALRVVIAFCG